MNIPLKHKPTIHQLFPLVKFGLFHWDTGAIKVTPGLIYPRFISSIHQHRKRFFFFFSYKTLKGNCVSYNSLMKLNI